jgi:dihydropyrimidinase
MERAYVCVAQVNSGLMGPEDFVRVTSTAAAQIFNIYPRKGAVAVGSDADVIVFDPNVEHTISAATHHSKMDTNVYEGKRIKGKVCFQLPSGEQSCHEITALPKRNPTSC